MKTIKAYWESREFDIKRHWETIRHDVQYEVADDATEDEINDLMKRRDVIRIESN